MNRTRRVVLALVVVELLVLMAAAGIWLWTGRSDDRGNAVNGELRGSRPPAHQSIPDLSEPGLLRPGFERPRRLHGAPLMIVASCIDCRSGQVIGGFLGRLGSEELPGHARVEVVGWGGDARAWRQAQHIPAAFKIHVAKTGAATARVQTLLSGVTESGRAYLYSPSGAWRSTFHLGQMDHDDLLHDLGVLAAD